MGKVTIVVSKEESEMITTALQARQTELSQQGWAGQELAHKYQVLLDTLIKQLMNVNTGKT